MNEIKTATSFSGVILSFNALRVPHSAQSPQAKVGSLSENRCRCYEVDKRFQIVRFQCRSVCGSDGLVGGIVLLKWPIQIGIRTIFMRIWICGICEHLIPLEHSKKFRNTTTGSGNLYLWTEGRGLHPVYSIPFGLLQNSHFPAHDAASDTLAWHLHIYIWHVLETTAQLKQSPPKTEEVLHTLEAIHCMLNAAVSSSRYYNLIQSRFSDNELVTNKQGWIADVSGRRWGT